MSVPYRVTFILTISRFELVEKLFCLAGSFKVVGMRAPDEARLYGRDSSSVFFSSLCMASFYSSSLLCAPSPSLMLPPKPLNCVAPF